MIDYLLLVFKLYWNNIKYRYSPVSNIVLSNIESGYGVTILSEKTTYLVILQNFGIPIKEKIINSYFDLIDRADDVDTFKHCKHISLLYKSKL